jgi:hypothetical protein
MVATTTPGSSLSRHWFEPKPVFRLRRSILLSRLRRHGGRRLVFIAGCARSGTSLLRKLMSCFDDVAAVDRERSVSHFLDLAREPQRTLVVKRTNKCYRDLPHLPACVDLIYCVRHPFDCLTSSHPETAAYQAFHVSQRRWTDEYDSLQQLVGRQPSRLISIVRYEDLVGDPDSVQAALASSLSLGVTHRFSSNPLGIEIRASSVGKWQRDQRLRDAICGFEPTWRQRIAEFCGQFGYDTHGLLGADCALPQGDEALHRKDHHG